MERTWEKVWYESLGCWDYAEGVKWSTRFQSWGLHADDCPCPDCRAYWAGDAAWSAFLEEQARAEGEREAERREPDGSSSISGT